MIVALDPPDFRTISDFRKGLLEALPRLARDAAVGVIVPAWWGRE